MKKRILVVDDEIDFGHLLKLTLEMTGRYRVRSIQYASQAVEVARDYQPDLILLDCMMPGTDGGEVAARVQGDPALKQTPFIFLTATVSEREQSPSKCYSGSQTYLPKTIPLQSLVEAIEEKLAGGGAREEGLGETSPAQIRMTKPESPNQ